jgi:transposase
MAACSGGAAACKHDVASARLIRPFAQGRRIAQTQHGARASANLYSLVSCARVNGLEPYAYLRYLFEELPKATTAEAH